jgi:hypothetical protein
MEYNEHYELILNHITARESMSQETFEAYKQNAYSWLNNKGRHLFEEDILKEYSEGRTLEKIFSQNTERYIPGSNKQKGDKRERTWYDIMGMDVIEADDSFFNFFFTCKLRHLDLFQIDDFLNYYLENKFDGDTEKFHRFLIIALRKYTKLLKVEYTDTVNEWMTSLKTKGELSGATKTKGKLKREAGDKMTCLNLEQTALLIHFLQEGRIILKDEYLNKKQAGQAFNTLTGYSADTLRQELGASGIGTSISKENIKELHNAIVRLEVLINNRIRNK